MRQVNTKVNPHIHHFSQFISNYSLVIERKAIITGVFPTVQALVTLANAIHVKDVAC